MRQKKRQRQQQELKKKFKYNSNILCLEFFYVLLHSQSLKLQFASIICFAFSFFIIWVFLPLTADTVLLLCQKTTAVTAKCSGEQSIGLEVGERSLLCLRVLQLNILPTKKAKKKLKSVPRIWGGLIITCNIIKLAFKNCKSHRGVVLKITGYENSTLGSGSGANRFRFQSFLCHQDYTPNFFLSKQLRFPQNHLFF